MKATTSEGARHDDAILEGDSQIGVLLLRTVENVGLASPDRQPVSYLQATPLRWQERHQRDAGATPVVASSLSSRERSILERISQGKSNKEIAKDLSIAPETVKSHVKNIFAKLAVKKRAQAVARAHDLRLVNALSCEP
jgi:ATP/maltotriose-dependent transcriptional regulator MalT